MNNRKTQILEFLANTEWKTARITPLAGDASNRRYDRLIDPETGKTAVLMDADLSKGESVDQFVKIAKYLKSIGLNAPEVLASNPSHGLLILEDLGDALFAKITQNNPKLENKLYQDATDVLITLHRHKPPEDLPVFDPQTMADMTCPALNWYAEGIDHPVSQEDKNRFQNLIRDALISLEPYPKVLILRDYHAENLILLSNKTSVECVGLLDFQDAALGHPSYDLVSLLQDARRDVKGALAERMITRYVDQTNQDDKIFRKSFATMGAQRNLRILGVFARLSMHYGKPHYVDFIPRVWDHLQTDLAEPALSDLKHQVDRLLPAPTPERLQMLKDKCATVPHP